MPVIEHEPVYCERCGVERGQDPADRPADPALDYAREKCIGEGGHFWPEALVERTCGGCGRKFSEPVGTPVAHRGRCPVCRRGAGQTTAIRLALMRSRRAR